MTYYNVRISLLQVGGHDVFREVFVSCYHLVSRGKKSKLLFNSGKRKAEALMTSVGFGVTRPRTCCFRWKNNSNISIQTFEMVAPLPLMLWTGFLEQKQDVNCEVLPFVDICPVQLATCLLPCRSTPSKLEDSTVVLFCFFYDSATTALASAWKHALVW